VNDQCKIPAKKPITKACILNSIKNIQRKETAELGVPNCEPAFLRLCRKVSGDGKLKIWQTVGLDPSGVWTQLIFVDHVLRGKRQA